MSLSKKPETFDSEPYSLEFNVQARKEWDKLNAGIRLQLARKLKERLLNPRVEPDKLRDMPDCYKIKLRSVGYRLVYEVVDQRLIVMVIAVGKRDRQKVYAKARERL